MGHFFSVMNLVFPFLLKLGLLYESIQKICILGMFCSICLKLAGPVNIFVNKPESINRESEALSCGIVRNFFSIGI